MATHVTGGDLARVYAAAYGSCPEGGNIGEQRGAHAIKHFLKTLEEAGRGPVHVGDPILWEDGGLSEPSVPRYASRSKPVPGRPGEVYLGEHLVDPPQSLIEDRPG